MRLRSSLGLVGLGFSALMLQGCIAAAIPLAAGGAIARTATDGVEANDPVSSSASAPSAALAASPPSEPAKPQVYSLDSSSADAALASDRAASLAMMAEGNAAATSQTDTDAFAVLRAYASAANAAREDALADPSALQYSALLSNPASLRPTLAECGGNEPTVLIDLDPAGGEFMPPEQAIARPGVAEALAQLREEGLAIAWISGNSAAQAGGIRAALTRSGLDPESRDQIILMRYPGDRKQTRRAELASASCVLAIAGDTRSDFDELFDFLVNPEAALGLELMIGDGWFLVPPAFANPSAANSQGPSTP